MSDDQNPQEDTYFEDIVKKTKTGITFPKNLRDEMFENDREIYFRLTVPKEKNKIILEIISEEDAQQITEKLKGQKPQSKSPGTPRERKEPKPKKVKGPELNWAEVFVYDFEVKEKVQPILESAYIKFAETPINLEDAMGRIKYALVSFLTTTKTENAKLYFAVEKFLLQIVELFNQANLIEWIFEKIVNNIESKFLYELALLELVEASLKAKKFEKAHEFIFHVLKNIDGYNKTSEMYNIMNSFKQLVKKVKYVERTDTIDILLKEKLMEYGEGAQDVDYKIQIIEFLEDLKYIELGYKLAKDIQLTLPPDSPRIPDVRKLVDRLHETPITEDKIN